MPMFHFLRPEWLWALFPLGALFLLLAKKGTSAREWETICDAHLLPHLLEGTEGSRRRLPLVLLGFGWAITVFALAGPVWSQLPQPVYRAESALVLVLDLSRSMDVQDVAPSRLSRAKHKILDVLKLRKEGQTALVVYAAEPFIVSPLTDDANTMITFVQSLETSLMPLQGSRSDLALRKADDLLKHVGHAGGDVLLLTDGEGDPATMEVVKHLRRQGRRVSVLGIGTLEGGPIPEAGGFLKDQEGAIVMPTLNISSLQELARAGGGSYATVTSDDQDIMQVLPSLISSDISPSVASESRTTDLWREEGPWLVLLLLALALPAFRPGWLGILLFFMLIPQVSEAFSWDNLWARPDQQGVRALEREAPEEAAALFEDPGWKGIAHYRAGKYQEAEKAFSAINTPEGHYNRGNALAQLDRYEEALASYQAALAQQPHHADAQHNLEVIKKYLEKLSSPKQERQSSRTSEVSPSEQGRKNEEAGSTGKESAQASDSTQPLSEKGEGESQENQEGTPALAGSESDSSANHHQSEPDENAAGNHIARDAQDLGDISKTDSSKKPMSSATSMEEKPGTKAEKSKAAPVASAEPNLERQKSEQALQQWLRRIPDDPGGLLRRKFLLEYQRRVESGRHVSPQERGW